MQQSVFFCVYFFCDHWNYAFNLCVNIFFMIKTFNWTETLIGRRECKANICAAAELTPEKWSTVKYADVTLTYKKHVLVEVLTLEMLARLINNSKSF